MLGKNFINIEIQKSKVVDEFAVRKDRRKAYQIFLLSFIFGSLLTYGQYYFATKI